MKTSDLKNINFNQQITNGDLKEDITPIAYVASQVEKMHTIKTTMARLKDKIKKGTNVATNKALLEAKEDELEEIIEEINNDPKFKKLKGEYDKIVSNPFSQDACMVNLVANFFGRVHYCWNLDGLYMAFLDAQGQNDTSKMQELKKSLDSVLCILKKDSKYFKGVKVSCNMKEVAIFQQIIMKGYKARKSDGKVVLASISIADFKRQFALYVISILCRSDIKPKAQKLTKQDETDLEKMCVSAPEDEKLRPKEWSVYEEPENPAE